MSTNSRHFGMKRSDTALLVSQVYDILWQEIVQRNLKPNEKLDINQLAKEMGASRTPVMDTLTRLHRHILNAFIDGDVEQARLHQGSHLECSRDDMLKILDDYDFL